jgi:hypothetical protein
MDQTSLRVQKPDDSDQSLNGRTIKVSPEEITFQHVQP